MSVAGILTTAALNIGSQIFQSRNSKIKQEFSQLGTDLQSGNLSAAQADFSALQQLQTKPPTLDSTQNTNTIGQDINQLSADLKAGNTSAAQQDVVTLQKDLQSQPPTIHHHRHHGSDSDGDSSSLGQMFTQLGSALQSGDLSSAQQAYSTMLQTFQQLAISSSDSSSATSSVSFSA